MIIKKGQVIAFDIKYGGEPEPEVKWMKGEEVRHAIILFYNVLKKIEIRLMPYIKTSILMISHSLIGFNRQMFDLYITRTFYWIISNLPKKEQRYLCSLNVHFMQFMESRHQVLILNFTFFPKKKRGKAYTEKVRGWN